MSGRRGRPAVLTPELVQRIAELRAAGKPDIEIARSTGDLPLGTVRYGAWLARHGKPLRHSRLQFAFAVDPNGETSSGEKTSR